MDDYLDRSDNELDYNNADIPRRKLTGWRVDPEYLDDLRDPLRAATGILRMTAIAIVFWATLIGIVWAANLLIGGG